MTHMQFRQNITVYKTRGSSERISQFTNHENLQIEYHNLQITRIFRQKITIYKSREYSDRTSQFTNHENLKTEYHNLQITRTFR